MSKLISWDNVMDQSLKIPGMKINRLDYLSEAFSAYGDANHLIDKRPCDLYENEVIEKIANDAITKHLRIASATSTVAGIPGGFAMLGTVPADLAQFYGHVLLLSQKLGYIYGWPDFLDENQKVTEGTRNMLTLFVGVMFGAQTANKAITELGKNISIQVAKRLPQKALTKTAYYPVVKEVGKWIGLKLTKDVFSKGISKVVPIIGGVISGGVTYVSFNTMSKKLQKHLHQEMTLQPKSSTNNFYQDFEDIFEETEENETTYQESEQAKVNLELISLMACINMAKIDFDLDPAEIDLITSMIDDSELSDEEKMSLLNGLRDKELYKFDLTSLKENELYSIALIENLAAVMHADSVIKPSEKIYFIKITSELGFTKDQVSEYLDLPVEQESSI